jgi:hypothetical protein
MCILKLYNQGHFQDEEFFQDKEKLEQTKKLFVRYASEELLRRNCNKLSAEIAGSNEKLVKILFKDH